MLKKYMGWLSLLFFTFLVGCGGGSGGGSAAPAAPATTYAISGTISGSGVPVTAASGVAVALSGTSSATQTSDSSGNYSFSGLANGGYTVTPSSTGYMFNPISKAVTVSGANQPANNFTMTTGATTYALSGSVSGATNVTIALSGTTASGVSTSGSSVSGVGGAYSFYVPNGSYTLTPSLTGYTFAPTSAPVTVAGAALAATTFVATAIPVQHVLSGTVSGAPTTGVTITVTSAAAPVTATTNASGAYSVNLYDGSYTVTPSANGYTFTPNSASVTMAGTANTQNFAATANAAVKATVNGAVTGAWMENVTITLSGNGQSGTTLTNAAGQYSFANLPSGGNYTFTPSLSGYTFSGNGTAAIQAGSNTTVNASAISDTAALTGSNSISGSVSYGGTKTGKVFVLVYQAQTGCTGCSPVAGTMIAAPGAYTIRGVPPGTYNVVAKMDSLGTLQPNANNPTSTPVAVTITASNGTANPALVDPSTPAPVAPTSLSVDPDNGGGFVNYTPAVDVNGNEIATSYQLSWTGTAAGSVGFPANGTQYNFYMLSGLANGSYSFTMKACVGGLVSTCAGGTQSAAATTGPVTIGATSGGTTVSGTVTYTGTATGPMYVVVNNNGSFFITRVAAPSGGSSPFTISGVPACACQVDAVIDNNNNGLIDAGDFTSSNGIAISTTGSGTVTANVTLPSTNATTQIGTNHQLNLGSNVYSVNAFVGDGIKTVVSATLFAGPNIAVPVDMGMGNAQSKFNFYDFINTRVPVVGDTYQFKVTYSDATTQIVSAQVTAVLNSFATGLTVTPGTTPTFSWTAPVGAPAGYLYTINVSTTSTGAQDWHYPSNSNGFSTTSVVYNTDGSAAPLTTGTSYNWQLNVNDGNGLNSATAVSTFTP